MPDCPCPSSAKTGSSGDYAVMKLKALIVSIFVITILSLTAFFAFSHYKQSIKKTVAQQQFRMVSKIYELNRYKWEGKNA